jgi:hypothetical protein
VSLRLVLFVLGLSITIFCHFPKPEEPTRG